MPILFELTVMMLAAYGAGFGVGWLLWGRRERPELEEGEN